MRVSTAISSVFGWTRIRTFALAAGLGSLIALTRISLQTAFGPNAPFLLAWPGMMLAAFIGGFWPTIFVAGVGFLVGQWVLETAEARPMGPGAIIVYGAFALVFAIAGGARQRGLRRAQAQAQRMAELQRQMVRVSRLNAMGEMAGSLAHELNQPLTAIANYLNAAEQLLGREDVPAPRVSELVRKAGDQAVRAGRIVARARASLDRGEIVAVEESVPDLVQEAVEVARAGIARDSVVIRYEFDRAADRVLADRLQVQQVILNLVRNAVEAMAERTRRELKIAARAAEPGLVQLSVADTGPGISPEVADRLFQPFVTGKPDGMGVGLSISRNIVESHGGRMWVEGNADGGATFHFTLKRAGREA
ncbi:ATP-binding protein [Phenylobacterium sp. RIFCSPHIGHO2_01_FULL_69_31]|uniref:sensor histidine kinase n=1 Tax=Phenylobacterium sp. RIFCSPHIGHO2_01_FULL_69_31 TaxID=1801944 RepID=UPI000B2E3EBE|nr:ATP-binding protein [Phenylobacterium sp. RIFCSPHIGHO2_01_FULL_69_31]